MRATMSQDRASLVISNYNIYIVGFLFFISMEGEKKRVVGGWIFACAFYMVCWLV